MEGNTQLQGEKSSENIEVFEEDILNVAQTDKVPPLFEYFAENLARVSRKLCFVKTTFHNSFLEKICIARNNYGNIERLDSIQGIGKSSSTLYYVLKCRKEGDKEVHYIDLKYLEQNDRNFKKLKSYAENIRLYDCVLIDHVTLLNTHFVEKIKEILPVCRLILIETGFTACKSKRSLYTGNDKPLDDVEFVKIWNGSLALRGEENLQKLGHDVYSELKGRFLVTPRLLHGIMSNMLLEQIALHELSLTIYRSQKSEIEEFTKKIMAFEDLPELHEYQPFILHTRLLLNCLEEKLEIICTDSQFNDLIIAFNIFKTERCIATEDDLDFRFLDLEIEKGTPYTKISWLEPQMGEIWRQNFPVKLDCTKIISFITVKSVLQFYLQNGNVRKALEKLLVSFQEKCKWLIAPGMADETKCSEMTCVGSSRYKQTSRLKLCLLSGLDVIKPELDLLKDVTLDKNHEGHMNNTHRAAHFLKALIDVNPEKPLLLHPEVENLIGFDYFVYSPKISLESDEDSDQVPSKKQKVQRPSLYLVKVTTGATHSGNTMGKALPVFKELFLDFMVHVVVMIIKKDTLNFSLTGKYMFSNVSVINLADPNILNHTKGNLRSLIEVLRDIQL